MLRTRVRPSTGVSRRPFRRAFTLIELMVAMVVLIVLMGMLFAIISGAQEAYSLADSNAMIYEKAHVLFDQLSRDLRSTVTSDLPGREVPMWWGRSGVYDPTDENKADILCVVVAGPRPNNESIVGLTKVRYAFHKEPGKDYANMVRRSCTGDQVTGPAPNPRWSFYGIKALDLPAPAVPDTDSDGEPDWVENSDNLHPVIGGVENFYLEPYLNPYDASYPYPVSNGTTNQRPKAFIVTMTLVDERVLSLTNLPTDVRNRRLDESRRTFRKIIFVGGEG